MVSFYQRLGFVVYGDPNDPMPKVILPAASVVEAIEGAGPVNPIL
ncbi:hypothetical protein [Bradyrhizobium sp. CCBAU 53338]|nr:hypothetical protein [Bradyrhizobium sp. CCBAU 53338]